MTDYEQGRTEALSYIECRCLSLLESGKLTEEMEMGIYLVLGIIKRQIDSRGENHEQI